MAKKPQFELSVDTRLLIAALRETPPNETATFDRLSEIIGRNVAGSTPALQSALRHVFSNDNIVFASVRGTGYKRLVDADIVRSSVRDMSQIRKKARRSARKLASVEDYSSLPKDLQAEHNAHLSVLAAITESTRGRMLAKIKAETAAKGGELSLATTLELFKR